jgi:hypothetical protein
MEYFSFHRKFIEHLFKFSFFCIIFILLKKYISTSNKKKIIQVEFKRNREYLLLNYKIVFKNIHN